MAAEELPICKCADITDAEVIRQLGISNVDVVIISMAGNLEASVMAITLCKEVGVPAVIVKCANEMHRKIMLRIGADKVVFPEKESGIRLAKNLVSAGFIDMVEISKDISMVELAVKAEWVGKNLLELKLRNKYSLNVVAIRKEDEVSMDVDPTVPLEQNMKLIVVINSKNLKKLI
jgi:trk system potassium uptake protein TrkA